MAEPDRQEGRLGQGDRLGEQGAAAMPLHLGQGGLPFCWAGEGEGGREVGMRSVFPCSRGGTPKSVQHDCRVLHIAWEEMGAANAEPLVP